MGEGQGKDGRCTVLDSACLAESEENYDISYDR